jgi:hypothetical protein
MMKIVSTVTARSVLAVGVALAACGTGEEHGEAELALVGVGDDGAFYRLPEPTFLILENPPRFWESFSLAGDAIGMAIELPVGKYSWRLSRPGGAPEEWPLERHDPSGEVEIVMARLINVQPDALQIAPDARTSVVIAFEAATGGSITFATGVADVSVDVDTTDALGGVIDWLSSTTTVTQSQLSPPPELESVSLPVEGESGFPVRLDARVSGAWEPSTTRSVCAPLRVESIDGGSHQGFSDLLAESTGGLADLCVYDDGTMLIELSRDGIGTSPTFEPMGSAELRFTTFLTTTLPEPAFDGRTLDLSVLAGIYEDLPVGASYEIWDLSPELPGPSRWYFSQHSGQVHGFTFAPAEL